METEIQTAQKLNRHSEVYVPKWLLNASAARARVMPFITPSFNYGTYSSKIFPAFILAKFNRDIARVKDRIKASWIGHNSRPGIAAITIKNPKTPTSRYATLLQDLPELSATTYARRFAPLLRLEYSAIELELLSVRLYDTLVTKFHSPEPGTFLIIPAKSIREGYPPVDLGDSIELRRVQGGFDGIAWLGIVWSINRAKGEIVVRADQLQQSGSEHSARYNILFKPQSEKFLAMSEGIEALDLFLVPLEDSKKAETSSKGEKGGSSDSPSKEKGERGKNPAQPLLFPNVSDVDLSKVAIDLFVPSTPLRWHNTKLNLEQRKAVQSIIFGPSNCPYLVLGPPGTGKTSTVVEATLQVLAHSTTSSILLVGASNPSADTLALRLAKHLSPKQLLRLNSDSRPFPELKSELLAYAYTENDRFALPAIENLLSYRVIVCSAVDAVLLLRARITNSNLAELEYKTRSTLHPRIQLGLLDPHFSHLIVDEAAQATEPELSIPISIIITNSLSHCSPAKLILCGDIKQLSPRIVSSGDYFLDESLMERLSRREVYQLPPKSSKLNGRTGLLDLLNASNGSNPYCAHLVRNYRSHPAILMVPSVLFYKDSLIAAAIPPKVAITFDQVSPSFPILLCNVEGEDEPIDEGSSFFNELEVIAVVKLVQEILEQNPNLKPTEISVIGAFREQVWRIRLALRAQGLSSVDVGNTEALQGGENRVVLISTVRSDKRWLAGDHERGSGFIKEPKRFNVALTRAKELLVVVGNVHTLVATDPNWRSFYLLCKRNGAYSGEEIDLKGEETIETISKLEVEHRATLVKKEKGNSKEIETDFDVLVGSIARNALI